MPCCDRGTEGSARIPARRLNPNCLKDFFPPESSVRHTIARYTTGEAEVLSVGKRSGESGHCDARYTPPKWANDQFRAFLNNSWDKLKEAKDATGATTPHVAFMGMVGESFG